MLGVLIIAVTTGLAFAGLFLVQQQKTSAPTETPLTDIEVQKKLPSKTPKDYTDPSGFSFQYPEDVSLEKKESNDSSVYADIVFTSKDARGDMKLLINDTSLKTIDEWVTQIPPGFDPKNIKDVKLGTMSAKEIKDEKSLMTASLDQGVLFTIHVSLEESDFWIEVYNALLSSFSFSQPEAGNSSVGSSSSSSEDVVFEGEEVIE